MGSLEVIRFGGDHEAGTPMARLVPLLGEEEKDQSSLSLSTPCTHTDKAAVGPMQAWSRTHHVPNLPAPWSWSSEPPELRELSVA